MLGKTIRGYAVVLYNKLCISVSVVESKRSNIAHCNCVEMENCELLKATDNDDDDEFI